MSTSPTTKLKSKPPHYPTFPFHAIRTISAFCSIIVASILVYFCILLKNENYKIPWTFLIVLLASVVTLLWLLFTSFIQCCGRLSPVFNMLLNIPLLLLWLIGLGLLSWGIYGTLSHSCTKINFGNDDGIMVCQGYKALFSFIVFAFLSQIALIVLDVRARVTQTRSGRYEKMNDVKLEPYDVSRSQNSSVHDIPFNVQTKEPTYREEPGWRPAQHSNSYETHSNVSLDRSGTMTSSRYTDYGDIAGREGQAQFRMGQFDNYYASSQQTGYDHEYDHRYENGRGMYIGNRH